MPRRTTGSCPRELSVDAGYYSEANLKLVEDRGIEPFIPPEKEKHSEWRAQTAPRGRIPESATPKDRMRPNLPKCAFSSTTSSRR